MKIRFFIVAFLFSLAASSQAPYTPVKTPMLWDQGGFNNLFLPAHDTITPTDRTKGWMVLKGTALYVWDGNKWNAVTGPAGPPGSGGGGGAVNSGTVAQLRAMSTTAGSTYFSTDFGGGQWVDIGPYDGQFVDDGAQYLTSANNRVLKRINTDGKIRLSNFGTGTNANLTKALQYSNTIVIDEPLSITANLTISQDKVIEIAKGALITTTGANKLTIQGKLIAGPYQIIDPTANVVVRPYSVTEIYPEWFGAVSLDNPRVSTTAAGAFNSTNAFKKAISFVESYIYVGGVHAAKIKLNGWYGINDQLNVTSSIVFEGTSPIFDGSGIRWLGNGDSSKVMIKFMHAEQGGVTNVGFKGVKSANIALRLKAAIELNQPDWQTLTQRRMIFDGVNIGDAIGYWAEGIEREFENGFLCSGMSANNDFHNFKNLQIANAHIGIHTETDQSIDWRIENYGFGDGGIMYQSDNGGDLFGDGWYCSPTVTEGVIKVGGGIAGELRISLANFSSEHMRCQYFINSAAKVRLNMIGAGILQIDGNYQTEGFALLSGTGLTVAGEYRFQNTRFNYEQPLTGTPKKLYIEHFGGNTETQSVQFINCTGSKDIFFKFPNPINPNNSNYINLTYEGETSQNIQTDKKVVVNARHDSVFLANGSNWLSINSLFNGETETGATSLTVGKKGNSTLSTVGVKTAKATTINSFIQSIPGVLPANSVIKGVSAVTVDANTLYQNGDYFSVGVSANERLFGTVATPAARQYNSKPSTLYITDTAEDIVIKGWREIGNNHFTLSGTTLTAESPSTFVAEMVGGIVRFTTGNLFKRELLITGFTSATQVTVANPDGLATNGEFAAVQTPINAGKGIMFYITYEQTAKYKNEVDPNTYFTTPAITTTARPVVLNEKQFVFNKIDTTGFAGGSGGGGGVTSYLQLSDRPSIPAINGAVGLGTPGFAQKVSATNTLSNTIIYDDGTKVGIGTAAPHSAFGMTVESNGGYFRDLSADNGLYIYNKEPGFSSTIMQSVTYNAQAIKPLFINPYGGTVNIGGGTATPLGLSITGRVNATVRATQPTDLVRKDQLDSAAAPFILRNALGAGIKPIYNPNTGSAILKNWVFPGGTITEPNDSTVVININKAGDTGTLGFTANGSLTSFTFVTTGIPDYTIDSKVFITPTSAMGAAIDWVEKSTESFTVHFLTAPSSGSKTLDYFITP